MIPQQRLSTETFIAETEILNPQPSQLVSRELGGVALQDPSQGLEVKVWTARLTVHEDPLTPNFVELFADDVPPIIPLTGLGITEVSLAFDQNMRYALAYVQAGVAKLFWYDTAVEGYVTDEFPGAISPRITLDDHRDMELAASDIILAYIQDGNLYFRAQRDRFTQAYLLLADLNDIAISPTIEHVCMNRLGRLQFKIRGNFYGG